VTDTRQELTLQDLAGLPLRALVAWAARCARRVLPILNNSPDGPDKNLAVQRAAAAVQLAEDFARDEIIWLEQFTALGPAAYAAARDSLGEGQYAVCAAGHAASAAALAHQFRHSHRTDDAMELVAAAWGAYRVVLSFVQGPVRRDLFTGAMVLAVVHAEFDRLLSFDLGRFGEAGRPLDPGEAGPLGPLWPEGPPSWYA
jgi:hypothetical protein